MQLRNRSSRTEYPTYTKIRFFQLIFIAAWFMLSLAASAQNISVLYNFSKNNLSQSPQFVRLAQGRDARLYGMSRGSQNGTVFQISTKGSGGQLFAFDGTNGLDPTSGVTLGTDGNFYGTTFFGGAQNDGVLFQLTPSGRYTILHEFTGGSDGQWPEAPPIQAADGSLYGSTLEGPGVTGATIYRYSKSGGFSTMLTLSQQQANAIEAPLMQASDGSLYGTSYSGGANGCGGVFVLNTSGALLNTFSFPCSPGPGSSLGALVQTSDGNFYGTTERGGNRGNGTIFKMNSKGIFSVLYNFEGPVADGKYPDGGLVLATDGNFYGSTALGGELGLGTLYEISPTGGYKMLYSFTPTIGEFVEGSLVQHTNGKLYGTASAGGRQGVGTIYSLDLGLGPFIAFVVPAGKPGKTTQILGQGLTGSTGITFNGVPATSFSVVSDTYMTAVVPTEATNGPVVVMTPTGTLTSNVSFHLSKYKPQGPAIANANVFRELQDLLDSRRLAVVASQCTRLFHQNMYAEAIAACREQCPCFKLIPRTRTINSLAARAPQLRFERFSICGCRADAASTIRPQFLATIRPASGALRSMRR